MEMLTLEIHGKHIHMNMKNKKVLYVNLKKDLYGCLKSVLLFHQKLSSDLRNEGFTLNPYDPCVVRKMVNGNYITVTCHMYELNISYVDSIKVNIMIKWIKSKYRKMSISRGRVHNYLGMDLYYLVQGEASVQMEKYLVNTTKEFL